MLPDGEVRALTLPSPIGMGEGLKPSFVVEQQPRFFPSEYLTMDNRVPALLVARAALALAGLLAFASGLIAGDPAAEHPLNVPPEGFVALFNGHDLTGWEG